jgi:hypothetical protein
MNGITSELYSEILPGLFMGGTADDDIIDVAKPLQNLGQIQEFDSVVTCYSWAQPMSWYVHENRFGFADGPIDNLTLLKVKEMSKWLHGEWKSGKKVLVRCQAGWNRSGLCTAVILMLEGLSCERAISLIREKRSPFALSNPHFIKCLNELDLTTENKTQA